MTVTAADIAAAREEVMTLRMEYDRLVVRYQTLLDVALRQVEEAGIKLGNTNPKTIELALSRT